VLFENSNVHYIYVTLSFAVSTLTRDKSRTRLVFKTNEFLRSAIKLETDCQVYRNALGCTFFLTIVETVRGYPELVFSNAWRRRLDFAKIVMTIRSRLYWNSLPTDGIWK